jgi:hypothetical protein
VVVDRRDRDLADFGSLNLLHHGGRVPPQVWRAQRQSDTRLSVPRRDGGAVSVDDYEGDWSLAMKILGAVLLIAAMF